MVRATFLIPLYLQGSVKPASGLLPLNANLCYRLKIGAAQLKYGACYLEISKEIRGINGALDMRCPSTLRLSTSGQGRH